MGRKSIFDENDIKKLSELSPTSKEYQTAVQEILNKRNISICEKTKSRLRNAIDKLRGRNPKIKRQVGRRPVLDKRELIPEIVKLSSCSDPKTSQKKLEEVFKEKFKLKSGKSPHRSTFSQAMKKCSQDIEGLSGLLLIGEFDDSVNKPVSMGISSPSNTSTDIFMASNILLSCLNQNGETGQVSSPKLSGKKRKTAERDPSLESSRKTLRTARKGCSAHKPASMGISSPSNTSTDIIVALNQNGETGQVSSPKLSGKKRKTAERDPSPESSRKTLRTARKGCSAHKNRRSSRLTGKLSSPRSKSVAESQKSFPSWKYKKVVIPDLSPASDRLKKKELFLNSLQFRLPAKKPLMKLNGNGESIIKRDTQTTSTPMNIDDDGSKNKSMPTKQYKTGSYHDAIKKVRVLLSSGYESEPSGREKKVASIIKVLKTSLLTIQHGKVKEKGCGVRVARLLDENFEDDSLSMLRNLYVCGSPGLGKTLCVEKALQAIQNDEAFLSAFKIVRLQGTTVQSSHELYSILASRLHLDVGKSSNARSAVLSLFCSTKGFAKSRKCEPTTVLFIDEIDKAPTVAIAEILNIVGEAQSEILEGPENGPYKCNVIVIGASNDIRFCEKVGISYSSQQSIYRCLFEHYTTQQLIHILKQRTEGLFDDQSLNLISMKVASKGNGDVRFLLQMADRCLYETVCKFRRMIERKKEYETSTDITVAPLRCPNPLDKWEEVTEIVPIIFINHVAEVGRYEGFGAMMTDVDKMRRLTNGARALLVAIICFGKTDTESSRAGMGSPKALNIREMREALKTYAEIKKQSGVIIGHEPSNANVNQWAYELRFFALIVGGQGTFGGGRSFQIGRTQENVEKVKNE